MAPQKKAKAVEREFESFEFVPFACHYSDKSLLTKNGELVQIIKIPNSNGLNDHEFRSEVIRVLNQYVTPNKFAVWVHTLRTKQKIESISPSDFNGYVDYLWKTTLPNSLKYKNCVYISLVRDAQTINHLMPLNYLRSLSLKYESRYRNKLLAENEADLDELSGRIVSELKQFGAELLTVYEEHGEFFSAQMEFIDKTLHFNDVSFDLRLQDLSRQVVPEGLAFNNYNGSFSFMSNGKKFYGAVISFKEAHNIAAVALQDLLNCDSELVVAQSLDFAFGNKNLPAVERQKYYSDVSGDKDLKKIFNFSDELETDIVLQQTNILIAHDSTLALTRAVREIHTMLADLGIVSYTEDIKVERAYWASLPGNFSFMRRQNTIPRSNIAAFACLGNDKFTAVDDCFFGIPVTFFEDAEGSPYALHFLKSGQSNTLIASPDQKQRVAICNLLASQASQRGAKVIYYDRFGESENFVRSIGGEYLNTLDMERIRSMLTGDKTIVILNSLEQILQNDGHEFFASFTDTLNDSNGVLIAAADFTDNCEALLPNFRTQIFGGGQIDNYANHFDVFEDEMDIINFLGRENLYLKEGYNEIVLKFLPPENLLATLLTGRTA